MPALDLSQPVVLFALFALVMTSLVLNLLLIFYGMRIRSQLGLLRTTMVRMLREAATDLAGAEGLLLRFNVQVNDQIPIDTLLPVRDKLNVAVQTRARIRQTINTEVMVNIPVLGAKVPVTVSVPLDLNVPIDVNVPVVIDSTIPVKLLVPIKLNVPVEVDLAATELGEFLEQVRKNLDELEHLLQQTDKAL
jgi:hypothetical protein